MLDLANIPRSTDPRRIDLEGRILVAHQAEFMPWLGFISKATMGDIYLILDDTQFKKKNFQNRNRIRFPNKEGWIWLNIPIKNKDSLPNMIEAKFSDENWRKKHLDTIRTSYSNASQFEIIYEELSKIYQNMNLEKLVDFNIEIIKYAFQKFKINLPVIRVSDLKKDGKNINGFKSDLVLSLVKSVEANAIVAGPDGKKYLNFANFNENNIELVFQDFSHPNYKQMHGDFLPFMSFIDLLFNHPQEQAIRILGKSAYTKI